MYSLTSAVAADGPQAAQSASRAVDTRSTRDNWRKGWKAVLGATGVANLRWRDLRHTTATRLLKATGNLALVQHLLGHASVTTTMRYAHVMTEDLEAGMREVSRIFPESETARVGARAVSVVHTRT